MVWCSLLFKGLSGVFSSTTVQKHWFFGVLLSFGPALTPVHDHWEDHSLDYTDPYRQSHVSAFQHTMSVVIFLPGSNRLLISWLQSPSMVILEPKKRKSVTTSTSSPSICHAVMGPDAMILIFKNYSVLSWLFYSPASPSSRGSLVSLHFLPSEWYNLHIWRCWCFWCRSVYMWFWWRGSTCNQAHVFLQKVSDSHGLPWWLRR